MGLKKQTRRASLNKLENRKAGSPSSAGKQSIDTSPDGSDDCWKPKLYATSSCQVLQLKGIEKTIRIKKSGKSEKIAKKIQLVKKKIVKIKKENKELKKYVQRKDRLETLIVAAYEEREFFEKKMEPSEVSLDEAMGSFRSNLKLFLDKVM